jgi:hypothetical protein
MFHHPDPYSWFESHVVHLRSSFPFQSGSYENRHDTSPCLPWRPVGSHSDFLIEFFAYYLHIWRTEDPNICGV